MRTRPWAVPYSLRPRYRRLTTCSGVPPLCLGWTRREQAAGAQRWFEPSFLHARVGDERCSVCLVRVLAPISMRNAGGTAFLTIAMGPCPDSVWCQEAHD